MPNLSSIRSWLRSHSYYLVVAAACLLWIGIILEVHFLDFILQPRLTRLSTILEIWRNNRISQHLFVPFLSLNDFNDRLAYSHYPQAYVLITYILLTVISWISGQAYSITQNFLVVIDVLLVGLLIAWGVGRSLRESAEEFSCQRLIILMLTTGIVLSTPVLWLSRIIASVESFHPYAVFIIIGLSCLDRDNGLGTRLAYWLLILLAVLAPLYSIIFSILILFLGSCHGDCGLKGSLRFSQLAVITGLALFSLVSCKLSMVILGLHGEAGASFLERSGLDGSVQYFSSIPQAIFSPNTSSDRRWHFAYNFIVTPAFAAMVAFVLSEKNLAQEMVRQWLIIVFAYFFMSILFAQWVSIHPYHVDLFVTLGTSFVFCLWSNEPRIARKLTGVAGILWFLASLGMLMTNFLDLARAGS